MIQIDGSLGEGGGQILRSALCLSLITQKPFRMNNIRGNRKKPGLLRQHLTAVNAAQEISDARVNGNEINSTMIEFYPGKVKSGKYHFKIGSAGSTLLVLQTVLFPLMFSKNESELVIEGGTHNPNAPTFDYIDQVYIPTLKKMGVSVECQLEQPGFYPAGGGKCIFTIKPINSLNTISYSYQSNVKQIIIRAIVSNLSKDIALKEIQVLEDGLKPLKIKKQIDVIKNAQGPGNVLQAMIESEAGFEMFCGFGIKGKPAEKVALDLLEEIRVYLGSKAFVGPYLADQLLLPLALSGSGDFLTGKLSGHSRTNIKVIESFLGMNINAAKNESDCWKIKI